MNILEIANDIVYKRAQEKQREYGDFDESLRKASVIASELCGKPITTEDMYKALIALKLSRMAYNTKEDTYVDMVAYIAALFNFKTKENEKPNNQANRKGIKKSRTKNKGSI